MKWVYLVCLLASCSSTTLTMSEKQLLKRDAENKALELEYLEEIRVAEQNNDYDAYRYYLNEYFKVERLDIPPKLKNHASYKQGGHRIKY